MKDTFFQSCGVGQIHVSRWEPEGKVCGVVQIIHGIAEHSRRYDDFARYLNGYGFLVVAHDHMGHGDSASSGIKGYFHGGWFAATEDAYQLYKDIKQEFPEVPYFFFGHSMGSFILRTIMIDHPECGASGCVVCGTGWIGAAILAAGIAACKTVCTLKDETKPSVFLQKMAFGSYNNKIDHPRTLSDWLSRDNAIVDAYEADPMCGFVPSAGLLRDMMTGIQYIQRPENMLHMNTRMPVYIIAGGSDPVGDYGKGVRKVIDEFNVCGMERVDSKLYPLCRHEILNEINKAEVYSDVVKWLQKTSK